MGRFYVPEEAINGNTIALGGAEAHHILKVMRLKRLDSIVLFDGNGNEYIGFIKGIKDKALTIEITGKRKSAPAEDIDIALIQAIPKKEKMDYIVEKATELGVRSIIPVLTERTIPDWDGAKKAARADRWRKIAKEASKQCGRSDIPEVAGVMEFRDALKSARGRDLRMIAALSEEAVPLKDVLSDFVIRRPSSGNRKNEIWTSDKSEAKRSLLEGDGLRTSVTIAIGPEGDFTKDEVAAAEDAGFKIIGLGPRVLKTDTAAIAVLSILNHQLSK